MVAPFSYAVLSSFEMKKIDVLLLSILNRFPIIALSTFIFLEHFRELGIISRENTGFGPQLLEILPKVTGAAGYAFVVFPSTYTHETKSNDVTIGVPASQILCASASQ